MKKIYLIIIAFAATMMYSCSGDKLGPSIITIPPSIMDNGSETDKYIYSFRDQRSMARRGPDVCRVGIVARFIQDA